MLSAPAEAQKRVFDPAEMLHGLVDYYKAIDLKARFEENFDQLPKMWGDPKLLRRAFSNLISNALKYSPEGGLVEISGTTGDDRVEICVSDHGIGIPPAELGGSMSVSSAAATQDRSQERASGSALCSRSWNSMGAG